MAGIVLVSDGADTTDTSIADALLGLKAEKLPVFTVGVGSEKLPRDIQIDRVSTPRTVLKNASLLLDVIVRQTGYAGRTVTVDVEDEGRIVGSEKVELPSDGSPATVRIRAKASESGPRLFKFRVAPQDGEVVTQNNVRESIISVRDETRAHPLLRGRAALGVQVPEPRGGRRQEPAERVAAAHGRQQVHAASRRCGRDRRRLPEDARGAVQVSAA